MAIRKNLGGDRLGSGNKMEVEMHGWGKSTHDLSEKLKTTMACGTLVPFLNKVVLPNDEWKIKLNADAMTHPTNGPLFGSFKFQLDVFFAPFRLYVAKLHNNKLGIALKMSDIKLPQLRVKGRGIDPNKPMDNQHINPSCILSYLGIRGLGLNSAVMQRDINATPLLSYWDIYKNYYANKQEEIGAVLHREPYNQVEAITSATITTSNVTSLSLPKGNTNPSIQRVFVTALNFDVIQFNFPSGSGQTSNNIMLIAQDYNTNEIIRIPFWQMFSIFNTDTTNISSNTFNYGAGNGIYLLGWDYATSEELGNTEPRIETFNLNTIDETRERLLAHATSVSTYILIQGNALAPFSYLLQESGTGATFRTSLVNNQEGLAIKTYQSDMFNAWLKTDYITQINTASSIAVTGGTFTLDQLTLAKKQWEHLNRLVASGGTYRDWIEVAYGVRDLYDFEIPMYLGGLSKEIIFQEVVSSAQAEGNPLGSLGGKGTVSGKHKGGYVELDAKEAGVLIGIMSITPRIDYSQGNDFAINLKTMDDLHKPAFDGIGYMDLITEQLAWFDSNITTTGTVTPKSAGKIPAWTQYQTSVNRALGNFATNEEMWMTLNRRYEYSASGIKDLTTYIDPKKFNHIWANGRRDAQNFWVQVDSDITVRRAMSARQLPTF